MTTIAFIGLGIMGYPMAGHLQRAGHQVTVYNRTQEKAHQWQQTYQGLTAQTPAEAAKNAEIVITCLDNDATLTHIINSEHGLLTTLQPGTILIDHATTSVQYSKALGDQLLQKNIFFVDAPVSGGQVGAEKGTLTIMCGASDGIFERIAPVLSAYSKFATRIGNIGSGQQAKMVNQICIAGVLQGLSEAIHFGEQAGLDMTKVLEAISKGAAQSWQMEQRGHTMLAHEFNFGFAVDLMRKDLGLVLAEARNNQAQLPLTALIDQFYGELQATGQGKLDTSSLIQRLRKK